MAYMCHHHLRPVPKAATPMPPRWGGTSIGRTSGWPPQANPSQNLDTNPGFRCVWKSQFHTQQRAKDSTEVKPTNWPAKHWTFITGPSGNAGHDHRWATRQPPLNPAHLRHTQMDTEHLVILPIHTLCFSVQVPIPQQSNQPRRPTRRPLPSRMDSRRLLKLLQKQRSPLAQPLGQTICSSSGPQPLTAGSKRGCGKTPSVPS